jgi:hypothetical protein
MQFEITIKQQRIVIGVPFWEWQVSDGSMSIAGTSLTNDLAVGAANKAAKAWAERRRSATSPQVQKFTVTY